MGRQDGILKIKGQVGGISFYKSKDNGYLARQKGGVSSARLKNDPAFARTRENGAEFGRAGKASKVLRTAFRNLLIGTADGKVASRLTREMLKVVRSDATNERGKRNVLDGETTLLTGFEFNQNAKLASTCFVPFTTAVERATGVLRISIPEFIPTTLIVAPAGTTHFKLISGGAEIDFEAGVYVADTKASEPMALTNLPVQQSELTHAVTPATARPLFLAFGIEFYQFVNGEHYPLKNGAHNALALVLVDGGV